MKRFQDILYVTEALQEPTAAFERAVVLAEENQARLTVAAVHEPYGTIVEMPEARSARDIEVWVQAEQAKLWPAFSRHARNRVALETVSLFGKPFVEVIREVLRNRRDLVIKPAETVEWRLPFLSSADRHLLRKCPVPVWLIRENEAGSSRRILAAVDFDPTGEDADVQQLSRDVLELSMALAVAELSELLVVHAWDAPGEGMLRNWISEPDEVEDYVERERLRHRDLLDRAMEDLTARVGVEAVEFVQPTLLLQRGQARDVIPEIVSARGVGLVVMGTVGRTGVPGLIIGNTAETVLDRIDCSVLALKPPGFVSPVSITP